MRSKGRSFMWLSPVCPRNRASGQVVKQNRIVLGNESRFDLRPKLLVDRRSYPSLALFFGFVLQYEPVVRFSWGWALQRRAQLIHLHVDKARLFHGRGMKWAVKDFEHLLLFCRVNFEIDMQRNRGTARLAGQMWTSKMRSGKSAAQHRSQISSPFQVSMPPKNQS